MPHAFIIAAAVTASVGAAVAFEVNVFKPWRDEHWTEGWAEGIKAEWDEFTESVRESFDDVCGDNTRFPRNRRQSDNDRRRRRNSDQQEEFELRKEMDEFSQHDAQVSGVKARYADEFDQAQQGTRLRKGKNMLEASALEDRLLNAPTLGYTSSTIRSQDDNETLKRNSLMHSTPLDNSTAQSIYNDNHSPFALNSSPSNEGSHSTWHSPSSDTLQRNSISDDWQDHLSARNTPPRTVAASASDEGESESETWTQLEDSRSASPLSAAWSETELSQSGR